MVFELPWQIVEAEGTGTDGDPTVDVTVICIEASAGAEPQPAVAVNVKVADPLNPAGGVHVAVGELASGLNEPPSEEDHVADVVPLRYAPPRGKVEPPWQIV